MSTEKKNLPHVDNYPPLAEWLANHDAQCLWQEPVGSQRPARALVECWVFQGGGTAIVVVHADQRGWDIYTPHNGAKVDETLADADARLGFADLDVCASSGGSTAPAAPSDPKAQRRYDEEEGRKLAGILGTIKG